MKIWDKVFAVGIVIDNIARHSMTNKTHSFYKFTKLFCSYDCDFFFLRSLLRNEANEAADFVRNEI